MSNSVFVTGVLYSEGSTFKGNAWKIINIDPHCLRHK